MYQKEIIYMSLYKDGNRLGNAGFLKVEKKGKEGSLTLTVKNAPRSINGRFPVRYYSGKDWKEIDGVVVREGGGRWEKKEEDSLEGVSLQIILPSGYLIEGTSKTAENKAEKKSEPESFEREKSVEEKPQEDTQIDLGQGKRGRKIPSSKQAG